jgi:maleate isomerase
MSRPIRVGLIVPSSNTTMETEVPALLRTRSGPETFTFHSSRMRMRRVDAAELARIDSEAERCAAELADAACDVLIYACLVAVMAQGPGAHEEVEHRLVATAAAEGTAAAAVSSAGALVAALRAINARRVALVAPYLPPLTETVVAYLGDCGFEVVDAISLGVADNQEVGRLDPDQLPAIVDRLDLARADAIVASACVQMPSLPVIEAIEEMTRLPVLSAATASVHQALARLGLEPRIPAAGRLLASEEFATA